MRPLAVAPETTTERPPPSQAARWITLVLLGGLTLGATILWARLADPKFLCADVGPTAADAIVVLGGSVARAERAAELFHAGEAPAIVVTGNGDAETNAAALRRLGVPAHAITLEPSAESTLDNARKTAPILRQLGARRVIVTTSWYHSQRAAACFRHELPGITLLPRPSNDGYPTGHTPAGSVRAQNFNELAKFAATTVRHGVLPR
jgi:uncharacterized SAM-binding protein YcdF (DUF218 family)